jgi:exonuclease SbcD
VGGLDQVGVDCFTGFSYTALGHLHRPQSLRDGRVNYSGSLMKYSFSEAGDPKSVSLVEIDGQGRAAVERVPLTPKRDLRRIEGTLSDLLAGPGPGENPDDYLLVSLTDQGAVFDAMGRLREVYPNVLHIERPFIQQSDRRAGRAEDYAKLSELDLFSAFFQQVAGRELTPDQREAFIRVVEDFRQKQRVEGE